MNAFDVHLPLQRGAVIPSPGHGLGRHLAFLAARASRASADSLGMRGSQGTAVLGPLAGASCARWRHQVVEARVRVQEQSTRRRRRHDRFGPRVGGRAGDRFGDSSIAPGADAARVRGHQVVGKLSARIPMWEMEARRRWLLVMPSHSGGDLGPIEESRPLPDHFPTTSHGGDRRLRSCPHACIGD